MRGLSLPGTNISVTSSVTISDGQWHVVHYKKTKSYFTLTVGETSKKVPIKEFKKMDYDYYSLLGEVARTKYEYEIKIVDFVWRTAVANDVNFVTGLYSTYESHNGGFSVLPSNGLPIFNRELPSLTQQPMPITPVRLTRRSSQGSLIVLLLNVSHLF